MVFAATVYQVMVKGAACDPTSQEMQRRATAHLGGAEEVGLHPELL